MGQRISGDFLTSDLFTAAKFGLALSLKVILIPKVALVLTLPQKRCIENFLDRVFPFPLLEGEITP